MGGRRAALGVAFKNARRNKRRTFYLVLLIAIPVMVAAMTSVFVNASYVTPEERATSEFGQANVMLQRWSGNPDVDAWIDQQVAQLAPDAERLSYRGDYVAFAPGESAGRIVDIDLENPLSEGILTVVAGRAPVTA